MKLILAVHHVDDEGDSYADITTTNVPVVVCIYVCICLAVLYPIFISKTLD